MMIRPFPELFVVGGVLLALTADAWPGAPSSIEIGSRKQLFIDDAILDRTHLITRVLNRPRKHAGGPVLKPERKWEGNFVAASNVIYDAQERLFKMWYVPNLITTQPLPRPIEEYENLLRAAKYLEELDLSCYAISRDGIHWERPELGMVEFEGSKKNNIFSGESVRSKGALYGAGRAPNGFKDLQEKNPARRYKGLGYARSANGETGICLYFSADGIHWKEYEGNPVMVGTGDTHTVLGWDPARGKYVAYLRPGWKDYREAVDAFESLPAQVRAASIPRYSVDVLAPPAGDRRKRTIGFSESADFIRWSPIEPALIHDDEDPVDLQFYGMPVMLYEDLYLGFPWGFRTNALTIDTQFAYSRDGKRFLRLWDRASFIPLGANGTWDDGCIYGRQPFVYEDRILFYYVGVNWTHGAEGLLAEGDRSQAAIGLATLPLDGFVSLDAGPAMGTATTRPLSFEGSRLVVNFEDAERGSAGMHQGSSLQVEVLDPLGDPIEGFELGQAEALTWSSMEHAVSWKGGSDLSRLTGQPVRLRFHLRNGKLYSFRFR